MGEFTPGPWELIWHGNEKYPFPLSVLADNHGSWVARDGTCSSKANARLIAAAPELYEALMIVRNQWAGHADECAFVKSGYREKCDCDWPEIEARCDAALAHARGEQP